MNKNIHTSRAKRLFDKLVHFFITFWKVSHSSCVLGQTHQKRWCFCDKRLPWAQNTGGNNGSIISLPSLPIKSVQPTTQVKHKKKMCGVSGCCCDDKDTWVNPEESSLRINTEVIKKPKEASYNWLIKATAFITSLTQSKDLCIALSSYGKIKQDSLKGKEEGKYTACEYVNWLL